MPDDSRALDALVVHSDPGRRAALCSALGPQSRGEASGRAALEILSSAPPELVILGERLAEMPASELIRRLRPLAEGGPPVLFEGPTLPADLPPGRVFFRLAPGLPSAELRALAAAAVGLDGGLPSPAVAPSGLDRERASAVRRAITIVRRLGDETRLSAVEVSIRAALVEYLRASRLHFWLFDRDTGELWTEGEAGAGRALPAQSGLAAYAARTGRGLTTACAAEHPLYERPADDPEGDGREALLVQPVADMRGEVHAVIVAARADGSEPFGEAERVAAAIIAERLAVFLLQFFEQARADAVLEAPPPGRPRLFRQEAISAFDEGRIHGEVIRISPAWVGWAQFVLFGTMVALALYLVLGTVDEQATGPAIVRVEGQTEVTATDAGTMESLAVSPGDAVKAGQVLARLHDGRELVDVEDVERQYRDQLSRLLKDPADVATERALAELWTRREHAADRLRQRWVRAPRDGRVTDVRAHPGDFLRAGDGVVSLAHDDDDVRLIALLPGSSRPKLQRGMPIRVRLAEYPGVQLEMPLGWIGEEVVGPAEAQRYLGRRLADAVDLRGPLILAEARLPRRAFEANDRTYEVYDGMHGHGEVSVQTHSLLATLFPVLKEWSWQ